MALFQACIDVAFSQFKVLPQESLVDGTNSGVSFTTFTIDTPIYLNYLLSRFLVAGGSVVRGHIQHIDQVIEGGSSVFTGSKIATPPAAVIVCAGIGARLLGGIEDKDVHPLRGQTIVVRAPWIKFGRTISNKEALWTYIIPRRSGDVSSRGHSFTGLSLTSEISGHCGWHQSPG